MASRGILVRIRRILGWWLLVGGGSVVLLAICISVSIGWFLLHATKTSGTIVDLVARADDDGNVNYAPVFRFTTADGRLYTVTSGAATNPPAFEKGESVGVLYDAANPEHARLKSPGQLWTFIFIAAPLGLFYALLGSVLLYFDRRYRRRRLSPQGSVMAS